MHVACTGGWKKNEMPLPSCPPTFPTKIKNEASTLSYTFKISLHGGKSSLAGTPATAMLGTAELQRVKQPP